jgi:uncharacterized protein
MSFADGYLLDGFVIMLLDGSPARVHYFVHCGHDWSTRAAEVTLMRGLTADRVVIRADEGHTWLVNDTSDPSASPLRLNELEGVSDIDLAFTPATNTLPIRRLSLLVGESRESEAAWLRFPELGLERLPQRYTRVTDRQYLYESGEGLFQVELEVDEEGVVVRYGSVWHRVNA